MEMNGEKNSLSPKKTVSLQKGKQEIPLIFCLCLHNQKGKVKTATVELYVLTRPCVLRFTSLKRPHLSEN